MESNQFESCETVSTSMIHSPENLIYPSYEHSKAMDFDYMKNIEFLHSSMISSPRDILDRHSIDMANNNIQQITHPSEPKLDLTPLVKIEKPLANLSLSEVQSQNHSSKQHLAPDFKQHLASEEIKAEVKTEPKFSDEMKTEEKHKKETSGTKDRKNTPGISSPTEKPAASYVYFIAKAINESENGMLRLNEIYKWMVENVEYYRNLSKEAGWKNSIRHNLSLNECFERFQKDKTGSTGKGSYWALTQPFESMFTDGNYKRRPSRSRRSTKTKLSQLPYMYPGPQYPLNDASSTSLPWMGSHSTSQLSPSAPINSYPFGYRREYGQISAPVPINPGHQSLDSLTSHVPLHYPHLTPTPGGQSPFSSTPFPLHTGTLPPSCSLASESIGSSFGSNFQLYSNEANANSGYNKLTPIGSQYSPGVTSDWYPAPSDSLRMCADVSNKTGY